jgi:hypothetical protein
LRGRGRRRSCTGLYAGTLTSPNRDNYATDAAYNEAYSAWRTEITNTAELIGATAGFITSRGEAANVSQAAAIAQSGALNNYLFHEEAVARSEALEELWECDSSGECSEAKIADLRATVVASNELDTTRDATLAAACSDLYSAACAVELVNLEAAFKSYTEAVLNGELISDGSFSEYASGAGLGGKAAATLYAEYRSAFIQNAYVDALVQLPVDGLTGLVDLAAITTSAIGGNETAQNQLAAMRDAIWGTITDPVGAVEAGYEQLAAQLDEAARLESEGDWAGAAEILGEVSAGFTYAAGGVGSIALLGLPQIQQAVRLTELEAFGIRITRSKLSILQLARWLVKEVNQFAVQHHARW